MQKQLFTFMFIILGQVVFAAGPSSINQLDTVYFDLVNSEVSGNYLLLPVFIKSDDVVNAVDFAMKFDLEKMQYDSLIIHNTAMSPLASYNTNDSTLRVTSFSVSAIPNTTYLITLRFKLLGNTDIKKIDFNSVYALLNGDACTSVFTEVSIPTMLAAETPTGMKVYPNPTSGILNIETTDKGDIQLTGVNGQQVACKIVAVGEKHVIDMSNLPNGNYFMTPLLNGKPLPGSITIVKCN